MALAASYAVTGTPFTMRAAEWFIAFSMCVLALLKLQDVESFSSMFLGYDLLGQRWVRYAYAYPFLEGLAGILMVAGALNWLSIPVALFIGTIGAVSVFKAVYVDKREIKCACVGGSSKVPLGFVSLTENLMMVAMAVWMLAMHAYSAAAAPPSTEVARPAESRLPGFDGAEFASSPRPRRPPEHAGPGPVALGRCTGCSMRRTAFEAAKLLGSRYGRRASENPMPARSRVSNLEATRPGGRDPCRGATHRGPCGHRT